MSFYQGFPQKSFSEVSSILAETGHESILEHLSESGGKYSISLPANQISPLPTYKFAIACTLASLGNIQLAEIVCPNPEAFVAEDWGDNISRDLVSRFKLEEN